MFEFDNDRVRVRVRELLVALCLGVSPLQPFDSTFCGYMGLGLGTQG